MNLLLEFIFVVVEDESGFPLKKVRYNCTGCKRTFSEAKHLCQSYPLHAIYGVLNLQIRVSFGFNHQ